MDQNLLEQVSAWMILTAAADAQNSRLVNCGFVTAFNNFHINVELYMSRTEMLSRRVCSTLWRIRNCPVWQITGTSMC